jgi:hypothetical protein
LPESAIPPPEGGSDFQQISVAWTDAGPNIPSIATILEIAACDAVLMISTKQRPTRQQAAEID